MRYTLTVTLRKDPDLSRVGLEDKSFQIKSIINDLDSVKVLSSSFEHSHDEGDIEIFDSNLNSNQIYNSKTIGKALLV